MTAENSDKEKFGYDYYLRIASSFASEGKYQEAEKVVQLMINKWPERIISKGTKIIITDKDPVAH